ncbi:TIGR03862 family flavoprotein [Planktotalea sp.]|uniref:TIGR03862 family flavoprotein n=1 Tax=Planktotalea sp. TaxID=2029877 RepID=UPI0032968DE5
MKHALIIGGGPAGLMAAEELARAGARVTIAEGKPSLGRKFLMAGKSGLNLTKDEPLEQFCSKYMEAQNWLIPIVQEFGPEEVKSFTTGLNQTVFIGSSGRLFPEAMKASPMLRAWLSRLASLDVKYRTKCQWKNWDDDSFTFETEQGEETIKADVVVFALGGASWARLGSDGSWADLFTARGVELAPFGAANVGLTITWSSHLAPFYGLPIKAISLRSGSFSSRGEAIISSRGLEGSGIYSISRGVREGHSLSIDLRPDWSVERIQTALDRPRGRSSLSNHLRRVLKMKKHEMALLNEWARPLPDNTLDLAGLIKNLHVQHDGLQPMDGAISTSGGVMQTAVDENLMLRKHPGAFCAGEMLDWEAPTGGYLLTACLATGRTAGRGAAKYLGLNPTP